MRAAAMGAALGLVLGCAHAQAASPTSAGASLEADITLQDGASVVGSFQLRGKNLTVVLPIADDGAAAGVYRLALNARDPLLVAVAGLAEQPSGPAPVAGMPAATITVRDQGKGKSMTVARPSGDPRVERLLGELGRCEQAARLHPVATLVLTVEPPAPAEAGRPHPVVAVVSSKGEPGVEIAIASGAVSMESAAEPPPPDPGVTPLPVEWDGIGKLKPEPVQRTLRTGAAIKIPVGCVDPERGARWVRALFTGSVTVRSTDGPLRANLRLGSKPVRATIK